MNDATAPSRSDGAETATAVEVPDSESLVESDLLVEEISIDGMCGVY
jgi:mycofactocin precursor